MYEYCFSELLIRLNYLKSRVENCYDCSLKKILNKSKSNLNAFNNLLEEYLEIISEFSHANIPPVILNNHFVVQNVTAKNIFINICKSNI
ncbi:unnamed protein product [Paramecium pentaurelia]|uniref:Uncharacterized protein n=1 Tax=Paramecium pentaurelia TaxID=43138 RepID=A0A8S1XF22_9CILI|nr:unnamed protein product [Paramecium pentaurelia]